MLVPREYLEVGGPSGAAHVESCRSGGQEADPWVGVGGIQRPESDRGCIRGCHWARVLPPCPPPVTSPGRRGARDGARLRLGVQPHHGGAPAPAGSRDCGAAAGQRGRVGKRLRRGRDAGARDGAGRARKRKGARTGGLGLGWDKWAAWPCSAQPVSRCCTLSQHDCRRCRRRRLQVRHVQADPLQRAQLAAALGDVAQFKCALVMCDHRWLVGLGWGGVAGLGHGLGKERENKPPRLWLQELPRPGLARHSSEPSGRPTPDPPPPGPRPRRQQRACVRRRALGAAHRQPHHGGAAQHPQAAGGSAPPSHQHHRTEGGEMKQGWRVP
jgi:hypothetical protein